MNNGFIFWKSTASNYIYSDFEVDVAVQGKHTCLAQRNFIVHGLTTVWMVPGEKSGYEGKSIVQKRVFQALQIISDRVRSQKENITHWIQCYYSPLANMVEVNTVWITKWMLEFMGIIFLLFTFVYICTKHPAGCNIICFRKLKP